MFVAARGGAGGKGNAFFVSNLEQAPQICEHGANGEDITYLTELRSMAHIGLIGLPNAGKSTLLRKCILDFCSIRINQWLLSISGSITRARPKVASYAFTTLQPHLGVVQYDDYEQVHIADLPGLIPGSHQNRGLGIQFLKHAERCAALLFMIDMSCAEPWKHYDILKFELNEFSVELAERPQIIVANKMDMPEAQDNLEAIQEMYPNVPVIPISAKMGTNTKDLLKSIRTLYDTHVKK